MFKTGVHITLTVLMLSAFFAFTRPSQLLLQSKTEPDTEFRVNYGIPTTWYANYGPIMHPSGVRLNSIGLDFICQDLYTRKAGVGREIYDILIKDEAPMLRAYLYPPLMPYMMSWLLLVNRQQAIAIFSLFILISVFVLSYLFLKHFSRNKNSNTLNAAIAFLLTTSYPVLFAYERGNNDILVLWIVAGAFLAVAKEKWFILGMLLSLATLLKLYPAIIAAGFGVSAIVLVAVGLVKNRKFLSPGLQIIGGGIAGALLVLIPLYDSYRYFLTDHFSRNTEHFAYVDRWSPLNHSLIFIFKKNGMIMGALLFLSASIALTLSFLKNKKETLLFSFCFLAAISTYLFPIESVDYNWFLALPLVACLTYRADEDEWFKKPGLLLFLLGSLLPRDMLQYLHLDMSDFPIFIVLQAAGLAVIAVSLLKEAFSKN